ncbi:MAG: tyrosine-type recombinase/integrase [Mariniphaga sp.]|nr:tyrosine-type recombinase/integrase [Mariniphaga sp.]
MFNYSHNGITVASILDTRRGTKDSNFPVKIRVTFFRVRKYYSTGKSLSVAEWEKLPTTKSHVWSETKSDIQISFDKVKEIVQALESETAFSFDALNSRLGKCVNDSLNTAFYAKITNLEKEERPGTQIYYSTALKSFEKFAGANIQFQDINSDWLKGYEKEMLKDGRSYTTIGMYMRAMRAILNEAKRAGTIKENQYPFGRDKYEIPTGSGRKLALTLPQIKSIITYTDGNQTTERYRDLWFFSYLCNGINFTDLVRLKYADIRNGEISYLRAKTLRTSKVKKEIQAILTPEMAAIIKRWGNPIMEPDRFIFPYLVGNETPMEAKTKSHELIRRTNKRLKEIGTALKIDSLSTYSARHSFATVLKRSGANIAFISESLGHADQKTTENYLASFEKEERIKNAALLTKF